MLENLMNRKQLLKYFQSRRLMGPHRFHSHSHYTLSWYLKDHLTMNSRIRTHYNDNENCDNTHPLYKRRSTASANKLSVRDAIWMAEHAARTNRSDLGHGIDTSGPRHTRQSLTHSGHNWLGCHSLSHCYMIDLKIFEQTSGAILCMTMSKQKLHTKLQMLPAVRLEDVSVEHLHHRGRPDFKIRM